MNMLTSGGAYKHEVHVAFAETLPLTTPVTHSHIMTTLTQLAHQKLLLNVVCSLNYPCSPHVSLACACCGLPSHVTWLQLVHVCQPDPSCVWYRTVHGRHKKRCMTDTTHLLPSSQKERDLQGMPMGADRDPVDIMASTAMCTWQHNIKQSMLHHHSNPAARSAACSTHKGVPSGGPQGGRQGIN
jgi:hypothetical protein